MNKNSYSDILKTSSLIGGAQGINMVLGAVKMKFAAVIIGPFGVGLVGTYLVIQSMIGTTAGLGIRFSAVRNIAESMAIGDQDAIGRAVLTLRRLVWMTGLFGALTMFLLAEHLSQP